MIYLKNISTPQMIFIPKSREIEGSLVFTLDSLSIYVDSKVVEVQSDLYIRINIELPAEITTGEHSYVLIDEAGVVSTGLLVVESESVVYEHNLSVQYEQYE